MQRARTLAITGALVSSLLSATGAWALNQARIYGTILDENKKPLPDVTITVTCPEVASIRIDTKSGKDGKWAVALVDATKTYHYRFEKPAYQFFESDLKLPINANERRDITLSSLASLGAATTRAEPTAADKAVEIFNQGAEASQMGDSVTAKKRMSEALAQDPSLLAAHSALALLHLQDKEYAPAAAAAEKVLAVEPQNERALRVAVDSYRALGEKEKAAVAAAALATIDPVMAATDLYNQGIAGYNAGEMVKALGFFEKSAAANPEFAKVHYMLGMCYVSEGNNAKAKRSMETFLEKAAADDPDVSTAKEMLAYLK